MPPFPQLPCPTTPRLPAEWEPQVAVQLTWPHDGTDWAPLLPRVEAVFDAIAREVARRQNLLVVVRDEAHRQHVRQRLRHLQLPGHRIRLATCASDDTWARDHGAVTVLCGDRPLLLDFRFDGWGGKYPARRDDAINACLEADGAWGEIPRVPLPFVLEGGAIESDGRGNLLTTASCLLEGRRNPELGRQEIEARLHRWLGAKRLLWLHSGHLEGDDTDGHIDTLARFCPGGAIAHVVCERRDDPHFEPLAAMAAELEALRDGQGRPWRLIPLPLPSPIHDAEGRRLPATYANFLAINGALLVPVYGDPTDSVALSRLAGAFPGRQVVPIDCRAVIEQFGSLHCLTMQFPARLPFPAPDTAL
ncbi:MAG TPA: agmatine deiminase family protein [Thiotrichales bacterium]|nr:agmatine deiminase family protein [Thiotrichales bacterium]